MKKKKIPAIIFNDSDYKYPKGLKVTDEDELNIKLKTGWNTGPVDLAKQDPPAEPVKQEKPATKKPLSHMNVTELMDEAKIVGVTVNNEWTRTQLYEEIKKKKG